MTTRRDSVLAQHLDYSVFGSVDLDCPFRTSRGAKNDPVEARPSRNSERRVTWLVVDDDLRVGRKTVKLDLDGLRVRRRRLASGFGGGGGRTRQHESQGEGENQSRGCADQNGSMLMDRCLERALPRHGI
jgi:hypothetical protein